jgi:hypothetical protein
MGERRNFTSCTVRKPITGSGKQSYSLSSRILSVAQEIPQLLWILRMDLVLNDTISRARVFRIFTIRFNIFFSHMLGPLKQSHPFRFPSRMKCAFLILPYVLHCRSPYSLAFYHLNNVRWAVQSMELLIVISLPVISSHFPLNIIPGFLSNTVNLFPSRTARDQVLYQHETRKLMKYSYYISDTPTSSPTASILNKANNNNAPFQNRRKETDGRKPCDALNHDQFHHKPVAYNQRTSNIKTTANVCIGST